MFGFGTYPFIKLDIRKLLSWHGKLQSFDYDLIIFFWFSTVLASLWFCCTTFNSAIDEHKSQMGRTPCCRDRKLLWNTVFFKPCQVFFCIFERKIDITFQPSHVMTVINQKRKTTRFNEAKCGLLNRLTTSMADDFIQVELWLQDWK